MTAVEQKPQNPARAGLIALGGAIAITLVALVGSMGFLKWRGDEQRRVLVDRSARCQNDDAASCDVLRSACIKRNPDSCVALADAFAAAGPNHDAREALRLLGEACTYKDGAACLRAAKLQLGEDGTAKNPIEARALLERGCEAGLKEACALKNTVH